ncbi:hypothetical protein C8J56DRAFT_963694 [Mycena floridula]|nr:hypothetical protein C8J56DRAFT_963694 [Mycena floridula]
MATSAWDSSHYHADTKTFSAVPNCINDDEEFIRNVKQRNFVVVDGKKMIKGGKRVAFLWETLYCFPSSLRKQVFLKLLEGSTDTEYIWIWNDGDEAQMEERTWYREQPQPPWYSAVTALEVRLKKPPVLSSLRVRERVQSAGVEMRTAMIAWLVVTSMVYKDADKERGYRSREEWDMPDLVSDWLHMLPKNVRDWLAEHSQGYDWQAFTGAMMRAGHDCHRNAQGEWLFMRSRLSPTEVNSIVHLGYKWAEPITCSACVAHKLDGDAEPQPPWIPPPALVALRDMWDDADPSRDFSKWLSQQPIEGFKEADVLFTELPLDDDYHFYLPWVNNTYPRFLRYTVTHYTLEEWGCMEDYLIVSEPKVPLDLWSWCLAMLWQMIPGKASHLDHIHQFQHASLTNGYLDSLLRGPEFDDFGEAILESGHTCWEDWQVDEYAAAMTVLNEKPRVLGLDVRKDSECGVCRREWHVIHLAETFSGKAEFTGDPVQVIAALMKKCSETDLDLTCAAKLESVYQKLVSEGFTADDEQSEIPASGIMEQSLSRTARVVELHDPRPVEFAQAVPPEIGVSYLPPINNLQHNTYGNVLHSSLESSHNESRNTIQSNSQRSYQAEIGYEAHDHSIYSGSVFYHTSQTQEFPSVSDASNLEQGQNSTRSREMGTSVSNLVASVPDYNQQAMDYMAAQTYPINHPKTHGSGTGREPSPAVDPTLPETRSSASMARSHSDTDNGVHFSPTTNLEVSSSEHNPRTMSSHYGSPPAYTNTVPDSISLPSKREMMDEIKKFLTDAMGKHGIHLQHTDNNQPKLPWLDFESVLKTNKVRMINWPTGLKRPGKGLSKDPSKGIAGVKLQDLGTIYRAIHHPTNPIRFIPENLGHGINTSSGLYTMPEHTEPGPSRKRPRQDPDDEETSRPAKHRGTLMDFS